MDRKRNIYMAVIDDDENLCRSMSRLLFGGRRKAAGRIMEMVGINTGDLTRFSAPKNHREAFYLMGGCVDAAAGLIRD